jgi:hypothetical protein
LPAVVEAVVEHSTDAVVTTQAVAVAVQAPSLLEILQLLLAM